MEITDQEYQQLHLQLNEYRELLANVNRLSLLSKYSNDPIFLLDDHFRFLEASESCEECYGYTRAELLGMSAADLRAQETRESFLDQVGQAARTGQGIYETVHQRRNGGKFPVEINLRAVYHEGAKLYLSVVRDISDRKRAEEKLKDHVRDVEIFNKACVGREIKMIDLEREVNGLLAELGRPPKYRPS